MTKFVESTASVIGPLLTVASNFGVHIWASPVYLPKTDLNQLSRSVSRVLDTVPLATVSDVIDERYRREPTSPLSAVFSFHRNHDNVMYGLFSHYFCFLKKKK